ncbi:MAG: restriction endonuclease subunit S, partial [Clostridia bacterium]|nr:restriction endonuclease subunit S [Clostridia bacterium]
MRTVVNFSDLYVDVTREGTKIPQEDYCIDGKYPIIDQGQNEIAGRWDDSDGLFSCVPAIVFGDHTRIIKYVDTPFFIGADGVKILRPVRKDDNPKYLYYALQAAKIPNLGYSRHFKVVKELRFNLY